MYESCKVLVPIMHASKGKCEQELSTEDVWLTTRVILKQWEKDTKRFQYHTYEKCDCDADDYMNE